MTMVLDFLFQEVGSFKMDTIAGIIYSYLYILTFFFKFLFAIHNLKNFSTNGKEAR